MLNNILFVIWFFLPAALANTTPDVIKDLPFIKKFNTPIDLGKSWRGKRIFGDHKTIRGFVAGITTAIIVAAIQISVYNSNEAIQEIVRIDYSTINPLIFGFLSGFGVLAGDAIESFFKRRVGIQPGKSWFPFDQTDYIIGGVIFTAMYIRLELIEYLILLVIFFFLHMASTITGYFLGIKKQPI